MHSHFSRASVLSKTTAQHSVHLTGGSLRVFRQFVWLGVGSGKVASSRPAHQRVTQTVGRRGEIADGSLECKGEWLQHPAHHAPLGENEKSSKLLGRRVVCFVAQDLICSPLAKHLRRDNSVFHRFAPPCRSKRLSHISNAIALVM